MKKSKDEINAFLGEGAQFEGKLTYDGSVRIDGHFKGEIITEGSLIVGETALVESDISASHVIVSGEVRGNINAEDKIEIYSPARVSGNIQGRSILIEQGAFFEGNCQMKEDHEGSKKIALLPQQSGSA
ncbi:MAG: polymer-forming cytoskeletal protein [Desulfatiglans sp.]|jgi:cytoskeletal protein CcmA (bactofilin family)|nr:polymer-forming cytoskeletal protein [Thermodesulfobacteriota bacterium]MEE4352954.1 polymer-forming cytoskeletal protein [Desulfatiglans sp.]